MARSIQTTLSIVSTPPDGAVFPTGVNTFSYLPTKTLAEQGAIAQDLVNATNESLMPAGIAAASFVYHGMSDEALRQRVKETVDALGAAS